MLPFFALDPQKTAKEARKLITEGKWEKAFSLCKKALKTSPDNPDLLELACETSLLLKRYREAVHYYLILQKHPQKRGKALELMLEHFGGEEKDKILLREHVLLSLCEKGDMERIESIYSLIPEREKNHFYEKHSGKKDIVSQFLLYAILFYDRRYEESFDKLVEIWFEFENERQRVKKELQRLSTIGYFREYADYVNAKIHYLEGKEEEALEYFITLSEIDKFIPLILKLFKEKKPEHPYLKLLFSGLLIWEGAFKESIKMLREALEEKDKIDISYAFEIAKTLKNQKELDKEDIENLVEILGVLGKSEDAAELLKKTDKKIETEKIAEKIAVSLAEKFSARAFRILLEQGEAEKIEKELKMLYQKNPDYLNDREVYQVLQDIIEEKQIETPFLLFTLGASFIRNGEYKKGVPIFRYLLRKKELVENVIYETERKLKDIKNTPEGAILYLEILIEKGELKEFLKELSEFITRFPQNKDITLLLLDEAGILNIEWIEEILPFIEKNIELFNGKGEFLIAEFLIRKGKEEEAAEKYIESYKKKFIPAKDRIFELYEKEKKDIFTYAKGVIYLLNDEYQNARELLIKCLKNNKKLIRKVARIITNKLRENKEHALLILYIEILILWGKYEEALRFTERLKDIKDEKLKSDIEAIRSIILWKKGNKKSAIEIIRNLIKGKKKFDPDILFNFMKEEIKKERTPFLLQTLGTLALLKKDYKEASRYYFMLVLDNKNLISKIRDIFITIESKDPGNPYVELYKKGLECIENPDRLKEILDFYEESPEVKDELPNFFNLLKSTKEIPEIIFVQAKLSFEKNENYKPFLKEAFLKAKEQGNYKVLKNIRDFIYNIIKENKNGLEEILFILENEPRDIKRFFELLKEKGFPKQEEQKEAVKKTLDKLFIEGFRDKDFMLFYGDFLANEKDRKCILIYKEALEFYPEEIAKREEKWKEFLPESIGISIDLAMKFYDIERLKNIIKEILENNFVPIFYAGLKETLKYFKYDEEYFELLSKCAEKVRDDELYIEIMRELFRKEKKTIYGKLLFKKLFELNKEEEIRENWSSFIEVCIKEGKLKEILEEFNNYIKFERKLPLFEGNYIESITKTKNPRFYFLFKGKRKFPLPLKEI